MNLPRTISLIRDEAALRAVIGEPKPEVLLKLTDHVNELTRPVHRAGVFPLRRHRRS